MTPLSATQIVSIWENGLAQSMPARAQLILMTTAPDLTPLTAGALTLGERNRRLLAIYQATFGTQIHCVTNCSHCHTTIEFEFGVDELLESDRPELQHDFLFITADQVYECRLITCDDLLLAAQQRTGKQAERVLVTRCLPAMAIATLSDVEIDELTQQLKQHDPHAELTLNLSCPDCAAAWETSFDIAAFLWEEITTYAQQWLADIHYLAQAYGWDEHRILALSATRRDYYLRQLLA
jgi:hypothetical protein